MEEPERFRDARLVRIRRNAIVPMVQPSQSEMRAVPVVLANILRVQAFQVAFVNCDDVVQKITPATP